MVTSVGSKSKVKVHVHILSKGIVEQMAMRLCTEDCKMLVQVQ